MKLSERLFNSNQFRPRPLIHKESDESLILIATPWGNPDSAQRVIDISLKYIQAARSDLEVTSPFEFLPQLSTEANALRVGTLLANDNLFRTENKSEYSTAVEFLALSYKDHHLSWAQVGFPNLYLKKSRGAVEPISVSHDLSFELNHFEHPLPLNGLGLERDIQVQSGSIRCPAEDQLIILSRSLSFHGLNSSTAQWSMSDISQSLSQEHPHIPYWLGLIEL